MTMRNRRGFTLIELLISIVILGLASVGLAKLLITASQRAREAGAISYRTAVLGAEVARITAIPSGSLADGTTTTTVTTQPFAYTMTTVVSTSGTVQTVTITVTPTGPGAISAISRTLTRTATSSSNPFS